MLAAILALTFAGAPIGAPADSSAASDTARVVLVATTDVHGRATAWDYQTDTAFAGGLARAATVVDSLRRVHPGQVVVVDAGDLIQGDPFAAYFANVDTVTPSPIIEAMNLIGYDAATPGNHEFNWGLGTWRRVLAGRRFHYVSANIVSEPRGKRLFPASAVVRRGPVRVGIAGFTTPGVMVWDRDNVRGRVRVTPVEAQRATVLRDLERQSDLQVVLIHAGMEGTASYDTVGVGDENVAATLARGPAKPDVVVVGHSHREMRDSVIAGVHFVQPKNWAQSLSVVHVALVKRGGKWTPVEIRGELIPLATVPPAPRLEQALAKAQQAVRTWVATPVGTATAAMPARQGRAGPTALVNWIHAVQRARTGADLSAASVFNPEAGLPAGPVRLADVAAVYPYENTLRAIRLSGAQLKAYLEQSARYYVVEGGRVRVNDSIPGYNFDMIGGAEYELDLSRPLGERVRGLAVKGRPVAPTDSFTLALNNYRQGGGGGFGMLRGAPVVYDRQENIRELLVADVRERKTLDPAQFAERNWRFVPDSMGAQVAALHAPAKPVLRVLAMNDFHGQILPRTYSWSDGRPVGGIVAMDALMDSLAADCGGCPTVRLDGGDQMQGTLISSSRRGRSTVEALNRLGLDAAVVGNHDLDWSVDTLRARMKEARYPWLAANVFDSATGRRPDWARPWTELTAGGLRIAVIGYMTPETKSIVKTEHVAGLRFGAGRAAIEDALTAAKAAKPDFTIVVAHAGAVCDTAGVCDGEILSLARELDGEIDLIVAGHTHRRVTTRVGGVPIVEARNSAQAVGVVDFLPTAGGRTARIDVLVPYADSASLARGDSALAAFVARDRARVDSITSRVVTAFAQPLARSGPQFPLGNLLADARRGVMKTDLALVNNGGIRADLPAGPATFGQLYETQPFGNGMETVSLTGVDVRAMLEHTLEKGDPDGHVSGIVVRYDRSAPKGSRVVSATLADGRPLVDTRRYTLAVDDFLGGGGSGYTMLAGKQRRPFRLSDVEVFIAWLRQRPQPVAVKPLAQDRRFVPVAAEAAR